MANEKLKRTPRKSGNRGKSKGSAFERLVAGLLDDWWGVPKKTFWRTTNSGGWVEPGDIAPRQRNGQDPVRFPVVIECKHYRTIDFLDIFKTEKKQDPMLAQWWDQVTTSQQQAQNSQPLLTYPIIRLLIFRQNNSQIFVGFSTEDGRAEYQEALKRVLLEDCPYLRLQIYSKTSKQSLFVVPFSVYIKHITKQLILHGENV